VKFWLIRAVSSLAITVGTLARILCGALFVCSGFIAWKCAEIEVWAERATIHNDDGRG